VGFDVLMANVQRLLGATETLAAIGAELRLRQLGVEGDPNVRALLGEVACHVDPTLFDDLTPQQEITALSSIQTFFGQAAELLKAPERPPGWSAHDPAILQAQGRASARVAHLIDALAATRPALRTILDDPGAFLDIGTGCGWIAIEAARLWPALRVVGIDPWETALGLARQNVEECGVADRIELRLHGCEALEDEDTYTLIWFPSPFIPPHVTGDALRRVVRALRPSGWMIFGLSAVQPDALGQSLQALRLARGGGHMWTTDAAEARLGELGLDSIETGAANGLVTPVIGRKPPR